MLLGAGVIVGIVGNWIAALPIMSAFGVAFIGNIWALSVFGVGLLIRGYPVLLFNHPFLAPLIPGGDLSKAYIPHAMMVGAGLVASTSAGFCGSGLRKAKGWRCSERA